MVTFLEETINTIKKEHHNIADVLFILPSKRAGGFLKNHLRKNNKKTTFSPRIISIEEFIEELSDIKIIDTTELLFKSYQAYLNTPTIQDKEDFEAYSSWALTLLNDFNEIDRHLVEAKPFFSYMSSIKTMEKWGVKNEKTSLIESYLSFWDALPLFYNTLKEQLLNENLGYQGLVYRKAVEEIEHYITNHGAKKHVFLGFNALNKAEQQIIQELLETGNTTVYWDADEYFYKDLNHSASVFLRNYIKDWKYYKTNLPKGIAQNFSKNKDFKFVEVQKNVGQVKYVGELLSAIEEDELNNTAIVLGDENLLIPLLYSLPKNIKKVNITMGVSLKNFPASTFFELLLPLHFNTPTIYYYKDIVTILSHPFAIKLLKDAPKIISNIHKDNATHLTIETILNYGDNSEKEILEKLFGDWHNNTENSLFICLDILFNLKEIYNKEPIEKMVLYQLYDVFSKIKALDLKFTHLKSVKTIHSLFTELINTTTLDFQGDAYNGLQIMGVLETRVLDFKNVIITSVNEGVFPSGKSNASFITYDLKQEFKLPQYTEKDAIYTYHFYHLLHRSSNITLLYNSHTDGLNTGEKSRFLLQLEIESLAPHNIEKIITSPPVKIEQKPLQTINKTEEVLTRIKEIASKGFSPSALATYIRNPIDFYFQKVLKIKEVSEVEETVAANTLGTIVHDTLESFYKPFEGSFLTEKILIEMKTKINEEVINQFKKTFRSGTFSKGKNLIIFEVAKRYISNFIAYELLEIKAGNKIKIIQIESSLEVDIDLSELEFPIKIGGKVDRVDEYNGQMRIVDYKTGRVNQGDLEIKDWEIITQDYKYSKAVQVLAYALMIDKKLPISSAEAGIISFKNLNSGFLKFGTKTPKNYTITQKTLELYRVKLKKLILEICNPHIPFTEKEIE
jgi:ATP-dependent helicase/nuclease subunit B